MNLWVIFLTGLTVGGLTCLAVQGGLLASVIAAREEELNEKIKFHALYATGAFLIAKLIAYTLLGFLLGLFGSALNIGGNFQTVMQLIAGLYMIAVALNLLNIHPIFRYVIVQPPRFLTKLVRNKSKSRDIFAPAVLGLMTVFIPCGTTLAMEALAISSANSLTGALIMGTFILGTMPLFFGIGLLTSYLGETFKTKFLKIAAIAVIYLGISSINGALFALGSPVTFQSVGKSIAEVFSPINSNQNRNVQVNQNPKIFITSYGYEPNYFQVKKGEAVNLKVTNEGAYSCAAAFRIPSLNMGADLMPGQSKIFQFTPSETGEILFSCSMGMYRGVIEVL